MGIFFCQSLPYTQEQYVEFQNKHSLAGTDGGKV